MNAMYTVFMDVVLSSSMYALPHGSFGWLMVLVYEGVLAGSFSLRHRLCYRVLHKT